MLSRYKKILISLFSRIQELRAAPIQKRLLALDIQEELLLRICRAESLIRKARAASKAIKVQLSSRQNNRAAATLLKRKYENEGKKIEQQRELILVLRSIGDAIPFIYGDRWDLKQLALKEEAGFISGKKGTRLERKILRHL